MARAWLESLVWVVQARLWNLGRNNYVTDKFVDDENSCQVLQEFLVTHNTRHELKCLMSTPAPEEILTF